LAGYKSKKTNTEADYLTYVNTREQKREEIIHIDERFFNFREIFTESLRNY